VETRALKLRGCCRRGARTAFDDVQGWPSTWFLEDWLFIKVVLYGLFSCRLTLCYGEIF
jgi:hypothetical protein